jgi:hypothetical protein
MAHNSLELSCRGSLPGLDFSTPAPAPSIGNRTASPVSSCETLGALMVHSISTCGELTQFADCGVEIATLSAPQVQARLLESPR